MIVSDNNALNSYLKTPPYFGAERGVNGVFEIAPPRTPPSVTEEREREVHPVGERPQRREQPRDQSQALVQRRASRSAARRSDTALTVSELRLTRPGQPELETQLTNQAQIRARLANSGYLPRQMVIAGGHFFDRATQARATLNASKVYRQRKSKSESGEEPHRAPLQH